MPSGKLVAGSFLAVAFLVAPSASERRDRFATLAAQSQEDLSHRGASVMGFSQESTTHHFRLTRDGGVIQVEANDLNDTASRDHIRQHLAMISKEFGEGNFTDPMLVHDQVPPGTLLMQRRRAEIMYSYADLPRGGKVIIRSRNSEAVSAIHQFLIFQIREHHTGDSTLSAKSP